MTVDGLKKHPVFVGYTALDSYTHLYDLMCWFTVAQLQTFSLSEREWKYSSLSNVPFWHQSYRLDRPNDGSRSAGEGLCVLQSFLFTTQQD